VCYHTSMAKERRTAPEGYVKTSFEIAQRTKYALEDLRTTLRRHQGFDGVSEAAIIEALILSSEREGVDTDLLTKVLSARKKAQDTSKRRRPK